MEKEENSLEEYMIDSGERWEEWESLLKEGMKVEHIRLSNEDKYIFYCGICRESTGTISIRYEQDGNEGSLHKKSSWECDYESYSKETLDLIVEGIKNRSFKSTSDIINVEAILKFYCLECDNCFCEDHWFETLDYQLPMCPKGHEKHRNY